MLVEVKDNGVGIPEDAQVLRKPLVEADRTGVWQGEVWNRRMDGSVVPQWLSITAVASDDSEVTRYVATALDLTELKRQQATITRKAEEGARAGPAREPVHRAPPSCRPLSRWRPTWPWRSSPRGWKPRNNSRVSRGAASATAERTPERRRTPVPTGG